MATNEGEGNNLVDIDRRVGALEATFKESQDEHREQMRQVNTTLQQMQATLAGLVLNNDNRQPKVDADRARGVARGAFAARQNHRRPMRRHPDSDDDTEDSDVSEFDEDPPERR